MTEWAPFEARIAAAFLRGYRWIAGLVGVFNWLVSGWTWFQADLPHYRPLSLELAIAGAGYLAFAIVPWGRRGMNPGLASWAFRFLALWAALDACAMVRISQDPLQFMNHMVLLTATGFAYPRGANYLGGVAVALASLVGAGGPPGPREVWVPCLMLSLLLSGCLHLLVRRLISELALLHGRDRELLAELQASMDQVKTLRGLVPICSYCKQVRNDEGFWEQVEAFVETRSDASFTHGVCPGCEGRLRDEFEAEVGGPEAESR